MRIILANTGSPNHLAWGNTSYDWLRLTRDVLGSRVIPAFAQPNFRLPAGKNRWTAQMDATCLKIFVQLPYQLSKKVHVIHIERNHPLTF